MTSRRGGISSEFIAVMIGMSALTIPLTAIAIDRAALARLDRRSADLELLQNALDLARHGGNHELPTGWRRTITPLSDGIEQITISGPGPLSASTLRRSPR
jgi:hypothetical protein